MRYKDYHLHYICCLGKLLSFEGRNVQNSSSSSVLMTHPSMLLPTAVVLIDLFYCFDFLESLCMV